MVRYYVDNEDLERARIRGYVNLTNRTTGRTMVSVSSTSEEFDNEEGITEELLIAQMLADKQVNIDRALFNITLSSLQQKGTGERVINARDLNVNNPANIKPRYLRGMPKRFDKGHTNFTFGNEDTKLDWTQEELRTLIQLTKESGVVTLTLSEPPFSLNINYENLRSWSKASAECFLSVLQKPKERVVLTVNENVYSGNFPGKKQRTGSQGKNLLTATMVELHKYLKERINPYHLHLEDAPYRDDAKITSNNFRTMMKFM